MVKLLNIWGNYKIENILYYLYIQDKPLKLSQLESELSLNKITLLKYLKLLIRCKYIIINKKEHTYRCNNPKVKSCLTEYLKSFNNRLEFYGKFC